MNKLEIPIFKTDRLILEPISISHSDGMFDLWSAFEVVQYSGEIKDYDGNLIAMPAKDLSQSNKVLDFWIKAAAEKWGFRWAVSLNNSQNSFIGTVGFNSLNECFEIAFHLIPKYWGKGFMAEASEVAICWAKGVGAKSVEAFIEPQNFSSAALAQRLGMTSTGELSGTAMRYEVSF